MPPHEMMLCPATEANPRYGEGSVLALPDGELLAAYAEFTSSNQGDMGAAHVLGRTSRDRGRTWGEPFEIVANDCITTFSVSLLQLPSGRILLAYIRKESVEDGVDMQGVSSTCCRPWFRTSDDNGRTWSEPWVLDVQGSKEYWTFNNDRLVRHSSGRLFYPGAPLVARGDDDPYHSSTICVYSDDEGRTWTCSRTRLELEAMDGLQEPCVVERRDGSLLMYMRTSIGHQCRSVSTDRGETWGPVEPVIEMISPVSPVSVKRIDSTGHLLAIFNKTYDPLMANGPCHMGWRTPLTATISLDDGEHWSLLRNIENDPKYTYDYVSITMLPSDEVLLTYHWTKWEDPQNLYSWRRHYKLKVLPVAWFYDGSGEQASHGYPPYPMKTSWPPQRPDVSQREPRMQTDTRG